MASAPKQYITPETKAKLEEELNTLIARRPLVAAEINERREEGDLKENAGYDAAREMQDQEEARIKQISEVLANATTEREGVIEGVANIGSVVHVYYDGDESDKETFLIGTRAAASENPDLETYSEQSPLGAAILGAHDRLSDHGTGAIITLQESGEEQGDTANEEALEGCVDEGDGCGAVLLSEGSNQDGDETTDGTHDGQDHGQAGTDEHHDAEVEQGEGHDDTQGDAGLGDDIIHRHRTLSLLGGVVISLVLAPELVVATVWVLALGPLGFRQ